MGDHIKSARRKRRLFQTQVAAEIGVSLATVINWETRATEPTPRDGPGICAFLGSVPLPTTTLGQKLYALRFLHGWTQEEAARAAGVSEDGWQTWEAGAIPTKRKLAKLLPLLAALPKDNVSG